MGTKNNPGAYDCYANAEPDEPMFVLLARDRHAALLVNLWAALRRLDGDDPGKIAEAERCANSMVEYFQSTKGPTPAGLNAGARALALLADMCGAAVRIEAVPLTPLRMGNWVHRAHVRARHSPGPDFAFFSGDANPLNATEADRRFVAICGNCETALPEGCGGLFADDGPVCALNK